MVRKVVLEIDEKNFMALCDQMQDQKEAQKLRDIYHKMRCDDTLNIRMTSDFIFQGSKK